MGEKYPIEFTFSSFEELSEHGYTPATPDDYERFEICFELDIVLCVDRFGFVYTNDTERPKGKVEKL